MRKLALILLIALSSLIACTTPPSDSDIQTAIAQTKTAEAAAEPEKPVTPEPPQMTDTPAPTVPPISDTGIAIDPDCSQFNAPGNDNNNKEEEYVCFINRGDQPVEMTKWVLVDDYGWTFEFPAFTLMSGAIVRVRTGCGDNSEEDLYWCYEGDSAVWTNDGDCAFLRDSEGIEVTQYCY